METSDRLTREQDGVLRRLTYFEQSGLSLSADSRRLRQELRSQDFRTSVREPWEAAVTTTP